MAILAECSFCRNKQSVKNKVCKCGADLDKAKRSKKVTYWISYRIPTGKDEEGKTIYKQRREAVGKSIEKARDADGKRRVQKRENRIFDMLPESNMTFQELTDWYLGLSSVKKLSSYDRIKGAIKNFNIVFGQYQLNKIRQTDLEEYQIKRKKEGRADATIDMEIKIAQTAVTKAFDNDKVEGRCLKAFRRTKRLLEKGSNARKTLVSIEQYLKLIKLASPHYRATLIIAHNTGMRLAEIKTLKWSYIDRNKKMIRLPAEVTKEGREKNIPINHHVKDALDALPRAIQNDFVITYRGESLSNKFSLKKQFSETCQKADIPYGRKILNGITFHDIRRTVKTNMAVAGVDKVYRDMILGHSLRGMDVYYIIPTDEALTSAMNKYTKWLDGEMIPAIVDQSVDQTALKK
jgi:integrase